MTVEKFRELNGKKKGKKKRETKRIWPNSILIPRPNLGSNK